MTKNTNLDTVSYPLPSAVRVGVILGWAGVIASILGIPVLSPDTASLFSVIVVSGGCSLLCLSAIYFTRNKFFHINITSKELIFRSYKGKEFTFLRKDVQKVISLPGFRAIVILKFTNGTHFWFSCAGNNINLYNKDTYQDFISKLRS